MASPKSSKPANIKDGHRLMKGLRDSNPELWLYERWLSYFAGKSQSKPYIGTLPRERCAEIRERARYQYNWMSS